MANPTFTCECMNVHKDVKNEIIVNSLAAEVFNQPGYTTEKDENVYFVHSGVISDFEEVYHDKQGD